MMLEKRKYQRVKTVNLVSYVSLDDNGKPLDQGMGKTLDISQGGLLMETKVPIEAKYITLMSINMKDELVKIKGKIVYCIKEDSNIFHIGIRFKEANDAIRDIVVGMIKVFSMRKNR
jgi:hypothetical protein